MSVEVMRKRRVLSACLIVLALALLLEVASYAFIVLAGKNYFLPLALNDLSEQTIPLRVKARFSHELGWEPDHLNDYGYRGSEKPIEHAVLAVFGDEYAQGSHTLEQSWPSLLEQRLGLPVLNFGVGGYGPDQAYLRFEEHFVDPVETPFTALIIMSGGIARIMNRYRGFYVRRSKLSYAKPMFKKHADGSFELLPNPLSSSEDLVKLGDPAFLEEIGAGDYWYNRFDRYGMNKFVGFPYAFHLAKAAPYYWRRWRDHSTTDRQSYQELYRIEDAKATLHHIVEQFIIRSKERGTMPIIVMLPNRADMSNYLAKGSISYASVLADLKQIHRPHIHDGLEFFLPSIEGGAHLENVFVAEGSDVLTPTAEKIVSDGMHAILKSLDIKRDFLAGAKP